MQDIITIAQSTFYRIARMKSLYLMLVICVLDVWAMSRYHEISLGMEKELMIDCALALCLVVAFITSLIAAFEVPREMREKTSSLILSKPGGRSSFIWGKFFGVSALCIFNVAIVALGSVMAYRLEFGNAPWALLGGASMIAAEAVMLVGIGLALSINLTDTVSAIAMFIVFALGHAVYMLPRMSPNAVTKALAYILPNFYNLDIKTEISHGIEISSTFIVYAVIYGLAYAAAAAGLANLLFARKDVA